MILRPLFFFIRVKNPWFFFLFLLFGWYVLFMFFVFPVVLDKYVNKQYPICQDSFNFASDLIFKNRLIYYLCMVIW